MENINPIIVSGKTSDGRNKYLFFNGTEYVTISNLKKSLKLNDENLEDWYNKFVLGVRSDDASLICPVCNKRKRKFVDTHFGYSKSCSDTDCVNKIYSISNIERYKDPEERRKTSEATKAATSTEEARRRNSEAQLKSYRENPNRAEIQRIRQLERYENPEEHIKTSESIRKVRSTEESKEKSRKAAIESWNNPSDRRFNSCSNSGKKCYSDSLWETGKSIRMDSTWELKFFEDCKNNKLVTNLSRCRFFIKYNNPHKNMISRYLPDFLLNDHYLIEIKPNYLLDDEVNIAKFNAADVYCRENGLEYVILTEDYLFNNDEPFYGSMPF